MFPTMDFALMAPELLLVIAGCLVMTVDALSKPQAEELPRGSDVGLGVAAVLVALGALALTGDGGVSFGGLFLLDRFAIAWKAVILAGTALGLLLSSGWLRDHRLPSGGFVALLLFATSGMCLMVSAADMVMLFLGLELMSLPLYALVAALRWEERSVEAGVKYLLLGSIASAVMLFGFALLYGFVGLETGVASTRIADVASAAHGAAVHGGVPAWALGGALLALCGLLFKVSAAPFHMWTPDVYEGAPTSITAWMSVAVKATAAAVLLRVFSAEFVASFTLGPVLWVVAALTMFVGNVMALTQDNVKRMLAYSAIAHAGYMLVGVLAGTEAASAAVLYYALAYTVGNVAAFSVLLLLKRGGVEVERLSDLAGVGPSHPLLGAAMAVAMLSLMGIPPLAGFFAKFAVFREAVGEGYLVLALIGVLTSAVSVGYYLRPILAMWMHEAQPGDETPVEGAMPVRLALGVAVFGTLLLGLLPGGALRLALESARIVAMAP